MDTGSGGSPGSSSGSSTGTSGGQLRCTEPPQPGLVAWWSADNTLAELVGGHDGQAVGAVEYEEGVDGSAWSLDGIDSFVRIPDADILDIEGGNFTVSVWVRLSTLKPPDNTTSNGQGTDFAIISKMNGNNFDGWRLSRFGENNEFWLCFGQGDNSNGCEPGDPTLAASPLEVESASWFHLVAIRGDDGVALYAAPQGEAFGIPATAPGTGLVATGEASLALGAIVGTLNKSGEGNAFLRGRLDEVMLFDRALSGAEVEALHALPYCKG